MHAGGVQDAMTVALPPADVPLASPAAVTLTEADSEELQVNGTPVIVVPTESTTVGVMVLELLVELVTARLIDCTGQVVKLSGTLVTLPMVAKSGVMPGTLAVTWTCPWSKAVDVVLKVATLVKRVCQSKTPTVGVISTPRLYAVAW